MLGYLLDYFFLCRRVHLYHTTHLNPSSRGRQFSNSRHFTIPGERHGMGLDFPSGGGKIIITVKDNVCVVAAHRMGTN
jgi:hypothetical protein